MPPTLSRRFDTSFTVALAVILCVVNRQVVRAAPLANSDFFYDGAGPRAVVVSSSDFIVRVKSARDVDVSARPSYLPARVLPDDLPPFAAKLEDAIEHRGLHVVRGASAAF